MISHNRMKKDQKPTMKRSEEDNEEDELQQQFKYLQQDWASFNQFDPRSPPRSSADVKSTTNFLQILDTSPRNLISSLQQRRSPSKGGRKVSNNDLIVEEILRERRAALESGKLKGRRLFEPLESASEMDLRGREEMCSGCSSVLIQGSDESSLCSDDGDVVHDDQSVGGFCYTSSTSSVSVEKEEREKVVVGLEEKKVTHSGGGWGGDHGERRMILMGWLAIILTLFALGIISSRSFAGYGDQDGETLIPT